MRPLKPWRSADEVRVPAPRAPDTGVPVIFLNHLAAVLDNWDPRVVDGIAARHRVITFDNRGVGASEGRTPARSRRWRRTPSPSSGRSASTRSICSVSRWAASWRRSSRRREPELVRKIILAGTVPAGGEGIDKVGCLTTGTSARGALTFKDPKYYLFFTRTTNGRSAGRAVPEAAEGANGEPRQGDLHLVRSAPSSRRSTAGAVRNPPTCRASTAGPRRRTVTTTGWSPAVTPPTSPDDCRTPG